MNVLVNQSRPSIVPVSFGNVAETELMGLKAKFALFSQALNLTAIKFKLVKEKDWTMERATKVEPHYKAFLFLIGTKDSRSFVPTLDIDEMWHMHILDTRKYMTDCARHFGAYVHHYPYLGLKDGADEARAQKLFASTCSLIFDAFDIDVRSMKFSCCGGGGGCSGGSSCSSGTSCSSGHGGGDSGGHGGGHGDHGNHGHDTPNETPYMPLISSCGTSGGSPSDNSEPSRKPRNPGQGPASPERPRQTPEKKRGILRKIFRLSPTADQAGWYESVTPELFAADEFRPDAAALEHLAGKGSYH